MASEHGWTREDNWYRKGNLKIHTTEDTYGLYANDILLNVVNQSLFTLRDCQIALERWVARLQEGNDDQV